MMTASRHLAANLLVALMMLAAVSMWTIVPLGWIWIGSQISSGQAPAQGPYMVVLFGVVFSFLLIGWLLGRLNDIYVHLTSTDTVEPMRATWLRSMRDTPGAPRYPTVLETVIVGSVVLAVVAMAAWFFIAAGSPLPSQ